MSNEAIQPVRIQRKRAKGSRLVSPNGLPVVCVTRPGLWGNRFPCSLFKRCSDPRRAAVEAFRLWLMFDEEGKTLAGLAPTELGGMNLACWCPIDAPFCHADVLIEAASGRLWENCVIHQKQWVCRAEFHGTYWTARVTGMPDFMMIWQTGIIEFGRVALGSYARRDDALDAARAMIDMEDEKRLCTLLDIARVRKQNRMRAESLSRAEGKPPADQAMTNLPVAK